MLLTFAVYFRATKNPFVNYDDTGYVTENSHVQQGLTGETFRWAMTSTYASNWHPLTWLSHALDCQLFGLNPGGHHLSSVLLHVLNAGILFLLLATATGTRWRSLIVAALFAIHPINVESVAWIAERKNVLSMFFFLLSLGAYGWYARRPGVRRYLAVVGLFALGLAAKPMIVTLPFALLLLDLWPLQRVNGWGLPSRAFPVPQFSFWRLVLEKVPLVLLSAASSLLTVIAQRGAIATNQSLPFIPRLVNTLYAYTTYVGKMFWPLHLASFYPHEGARLGGWQVLLCLAFLSSITFLVWKQRERPYLLVGWCWYLGTLIPVIGLIQVGDQGMADRYAYLPLLGIFVMLVWGTVDLVRRYQLNPRVGAVAAAFLIAVLSFMTWRQIGYWKSSYDLWSHALAVTKDNYMAEDFVGSALLLNAYEANGQRYSDDALVHFQNAVRINPGDAISHLNLGADFHEHGKLQEAIQQYLMVLQLTPDPDLVKKTFIDLGAAYQQAGDYVKAGEYYREVLKTDPHNRVVFANLGKLGMEERIQQLSTAAAANPTPQAYLQLGQLQQAAGHPDHARASYQEALNRDPHFSAAQSALRGLAAAEHP
jgi:tetratricopeptide (TPR) repeat protein